jgi:hypothetical protein
MTQADSVHSTPPTSTSADPTRRRFLSTAAGLVAGGAAVALSAPPARASADPVFALIEAHRAACAAVTAAYTEISRLESLGDWDSDGGAGVADAAEWSALCDLVEAFPTTLAGVIALMTHISEVVEEFGRIDEHLIVEFLANLAEALEGLVVRA